MFSACLVINFGEYCKKEYSHCLALSDHFEIWISRLGENKVRNWCIKLSGIFYHLRFIIYNKMATSCHKSESFPLFLLMGECFIIYIFGFLFVLFFPIQTWLAFLVSSAFSASLAIYSIYIFFYFHVESNIESKVSYKEIIW